MVVFKTNKENKEYLTLDTTISLGVIITDKSFPDEIRKEAEFMYNSLVLFEKENHLSYTSRIAIAKSEKLARYLLENVDNKKIINEDMYITPARLVTALEISLLESCVKEDIVKEDDPTYQDSEQIVYENGEYKKRILTEVDLRKNSIKKVAFIKMI